MIKIKIYGGLGNQMFQYAFAKSKSIQLKTEIQLEILNYKKSRTKDFTERNFELKIFNLNDNKLTLKKIISIRELLFKLLNVISFFLLKKGLQNSFYFVERYFYFNSEESKIKSNCTLIGYWQSYKYFEKVESIIRMNFRFPDISINDINNINIQKIITNTNSISIHIRRGDFVDNNSHTIHGVCSLNYYQSAINYICNSVNKPVFFIFSDDIKWVKKNLDLTHEFYHIDWNIGNKSYIDMQLMSNCNHNIIANSSFSWWGAWLNSNPDKIVIAPKKWFSDKKLNTQTYDLIPAEWIRM